MSTCRFDRRPMHAEATGPAGTMTLCTDHHAEWLVFVDLLASLAVLGGHGVITTTKEG